MRYSTITAIGVFSAVNGGATDYLRLIPGRCSGGAAPTLRVTQEDAPGADGVLAFPNLKGAWPITLVGDLIIESDGSESGYFTAIDTLLGSLQSALDALDAAPDDLVHSGGTLSVMAGAALDPTWEGNTMVCTFGLLVAG